MFEVATTQQNNDSSILGTLNREGGGLRQFNFHAIF